MRIAWSEKLRTRRLRIGAPENGGASGAPIYPTAPLTAWGDCAAAPAGGRPSPDAGLGHTPTQLRNGHPHAARALRPTPRITILFGKRDGAADRLCLAGIGLGKSPSALDDFPPRFLADDNISRIEHGLFRSNKCVCGRSSRSDSGSPRPLGKTGNHAKGSTPAFLANSWNMPDCAGVIVWTRARLRMFVEATMAKTSHTSRTTSRKSPTRWSAEVTRGFYPEGPRYIAASLKRSAEASRRKKAPSYRSALSMLTFYINRADTNLSPTRRRILMRAKDELRKQFGRA
jgi:hypothetical protein